ncbi:MAG: histidine phosphatase family protein [Pseudomonadales bacterium]|nr:histidine phosphatase family protein [Pseudomonadales bacterium]
MSGEYGDATVDLLSRVLDAGAQHAVALMRHSAREFVPGRHDLENPLTPEGRDLALRLGERLPKHLTVRAYASPPARCMDTAELVLEGHRAGGGAVTRHRPLEGLGVFYALDQMKMWQAMRAAGGLGTFVRAWARGAAPDDALMPADLAARMILRVLAARLKTPVASAQLDLCVSHDMSLYLVREVLLDEPADGAEVRFLDALVLYEADGGYWLTSQHGAPRRVNDLM